MLFDAAVDWGAFWPAGRVVVGGAGGGRGAVGDFPRRPSTDGTCPRRCPRGALPFTSGVNGCRHGVNEPASTCGSDGICVVNDNVTKLSDTCCFVHSKGMPTRGVAFLRRLRISNNSVSNSNGTRGNCVVHNNHRVRFACRGF